jgi:hypothetical protein
VDDADPVETTILVGSPDREVSEAVAVEVTCGECPTELVIGLGPISDARAALTPELITVGGEPVRCAIEDVDCAGVRRPPIFVVDADRQIVAAVAVEVVGRQRPTELVASLSAVSDARTVLGPQLRSIGGETRR